MSFHNCSSKANFRLIVSEGMKPGGFYRARVFCTDIGVRYVVYTDFMLHIAVDFALIMYILINRIIKYVYARI